MPTLAPLLRPRVQLGHQPRASDLASDAAVASPPVPRAEVRAAQQVAGRWLAFSPRRPVGEGVWSTLDQARVGWMDGQTALPASRLQVDQQSLGVLPVFAPDHASVRLADDHNRPVGDGLAPGFPPQIENTVEGHMTKDR
jgi:hypothetical protein